MPNTCPLRTTCGVPPAVAGGENANEQLRLSAAVGAQGLPGLRHTSRVCPGPVQVDSGDEIDGMRTKDELRYDPEAACARAPEGPEEVRLAVCVADAELAVGSDDLDLGDVVAGEPQCP